MGNQAGQGHVTLIGHGMGVAVGDDTAPDRAEFDEVGARETLKDGFDLVRAGVAEMGGGFGGQNQNPG
ncbi:hypothetical protein ACFCYH_12160 [Streptomyces sp. NPDC056400]|uniref:hypothetical protein n=1 Tax=Streptomyces sp. NPDC056400 TaxID=3345808 RepID=UPI0035D5FFD0